MGELPQNMPTERAASEPPEHSENPEKTELNPTKRRFPWLIAALAFAIIIPVALVSWIWIYAISSDSSNLSAERQVYIPSKTSFSQINKILVESYVIEDDIRFQLLARYLGVSTRLKAGEYIFTAKHTPLSILKDLEQGKTIPRALTITEGLNLYQVAQKIADSGWGKKEDILLLMSDSGLLNKLNVNARSLEGYLFPDTYFFERSDSSAHIIATMVKRMQAVFAEECGKAVKRENISYDCGDQSEDGATDVKQDGKVGGLHFSINQILTLASIVEKETGFSEERPLVAEVFINRLKKGMRLQADPTVVYGLKKFGEKLSKKDLRTPTPYNTYTQKGLPLGPICNPGRASISAVFHPAKENYYYFVLQNGERHYFSKSLKEHNRAVARLRKFEKEK